MDGDKSDCWALDLGAGLYRLARLEPDVLGPPQDLLVGWFSAAGADWEAELSQILEQRAHYREQRPQECPELRLTLSDGTPFRAAEWALSPGRPGSWHLTGTPADGSDVTVIMDYVRGPRPGWIRRRTRVRNNGSQSIRVTAVSACRTTLLPGSWTMGSLYGQWADEAHYQECRLPVGAARIESRNGRSSFGHVPWCTLEEAASGHACCVALEWSGNWSITSERDIGGAVSLEAAGTLPPEGRLLTAHAELATPWTWVGFGSNGAGTLAAQLVGMQRSALETRRPAPVPVQFNSWYPAPGHTPVSRMVQFADVAARLGCEVFVLDAGWYTNRRSSPDEDWGEQLGDWVVQASSFPDGLGELRERVREHGMRFGIWMEPEVASATSAVYAQHPDWFHRRDGIELGRGARRILHLGVPDVAAHVRQTVLDVVDMWDADWLKWDFNTDIIAGDDRPEFGGLDGHIEGLYATWDWLGRQRPNLVLENCASGGGRLDQGAATRSDVSWMSDMVSPFNALSIRFGASRAFSPRWLNSWLVEWPPDRVVAPTALDIVSPDPAVAPDLLFRMHIAMMGVFGISAPVDHWGEADVELAAEQIALYQSLRNVIQGGSCHRFSSDPVRSGSWDWACMGFQARSAGQAALFVFRLLDDKGECTFELPESWDLSHARVRSGDARITTRQRTLTVQIEQRMRSCIIEF